MTTRPKASTLPLYQFVFISETASVGVRATSAGDVNAKDTWALVPGGIAPANLSPLTALAPQNSTIRGQDATASFASVGGDVLLTPGAGSVGNVSGNVQIKDTAGNSGWNTGHLKLGIYHLWVDASGRLRAKNSAPVSDTDGIVIGFDYVGNATYDPPNLVDGAGTTTTIAVAGAVLGDLAIASFSLDLQGITVTAYVSVAGTVSVRFQNETGGALDLASGTLRVKVIKQ